METSLINGEDEKDSDDAQQRKSKQAFESLMMQVRIAQKNG